MSFSDFLDASKKTLTKNKMINSLCFDYSGICTSSRKPIKFGTNCMGNDGSYPCWTGYFYGLKS